MHKQLTFYNNKLSSNGMGVAIALTEAKASFSYYEIDFLNKPEWFTTLINPAGQVPAMTYGGPSVLPSSPSPESAKLAESTILLELVADLYPSSGLLPSDPVKRAKVRFFTHTVVTRYLASYARWWLRGERGAWRGVYEGALALQALLPENGEGYAVGEEFTIADCDFAPLAGRVRIAYERGIGRFDPAEAPLLREAMDGPELERFRRYLDRVMARPSVQAHYGEEWIAEGTKDLVAIFNKRFSEA
ncbi:hypothetical protein CONPUDRAFT_77706 [Coniophora puteana RWD-64-598 SS2]|uniref:Glutathione S-transferase C-terminal-like protein n=1 Tax=Coniophora puteana (strain RWD-64-598) TaxID=741705 RepID=A0A5M3M777_CONPW|nr:uncharacterized protein CONPUDRAFT_77706 [Coniophora puteana RWD-64-598 SS2]EIW74903.1 hypothetical protein CONPUDRAFT_77706 [Coniophora puteana RWD-64-598 SS2]